MKKDILLICLAFVPSVLFAQNVTPKAQNTRVSDSDFYDEYEYEEEITDSESSNSSFTPDAFILDDSDGIYTISVSDEETPQSDKSNSETVPPRIESPARTSTATTTPATATTPAAQTTQRQPSSEPVRATAEPEPTPAVIPTAAATTTASSSALTSQPASAQPTQPESTINDDDFIYTPSAMSEKVEVQGNEDQVTYIEPKVSEQPEQPQEEEQQEEEEEERHFNGEGHHLQIGFGGGWSNMLTRVSEDFGKSLLSAPTFTGNISYFYYPLQWVGVGTGLDISQYRGNILFNDNVVRLYDKITDSDGAYRFIEDANGERYRHRIDMSNFNEIENLFYLSLPIALQFKYKFGGIAGIYSTLGVKIGLPIVSTYQIKAGQIEHFGYYGQYDLERHNVEGMFGSLDYTNRSGAYRMGKQLIPINFFGYAELGAVIRLTEKLDLLVGAYFNIAAHDISMVHADAKKAPLGFNSETYPYPWMNTYNGLIGTDMLGEIRPYNVGVKAAIDFNYAPKKQKKDKEEDDADKDKLKKRATSNGVDTIRDTLVIIHDTIIIHRVTDHYEYDTVGFDAEKERRMRAYMDANSENPYLNGTKYRAPGSNSFNPADGYDYEYNKEALEKGRKYSNDLHNRNEALSGDEQELIDYLSQLSIRFQLDRAYPPFVVPRKGLNVLAATLKENPDLVIAVNGHACRLGTEKYNRRLALRRARNVAKLLKMRGVDESQMLIASYGSHVPSAYGDHNLSKDRRVEIVLLGSMTYEQREAYLNKFAEQIQIQTMIQDGDRDNSYDLYNKFSNEIEVQKGSSLAKIAKSYYGDRDFWVYLYEANSDIIANPHIIEPGTVLMVPDKQLIINGRDMSEVKRETIQLREYYLKQIGYNGNEL